MKYFKKVMEIIGLSILVNENTEFCSFVDFSGHVKHVKIRIYKTKDADPDERLHSVYVYYEEENYRSDDDILFGFEDAKNLLSNYLFNPTIRKNFRYDGVENVCPKCQSTEIHIEINPIGEVFCYCKNCKNSWPNSDEA